MAGHDMRGMLIRLRPPPTFGAWYTELASGDKAQVLDAFDRIVHATLDGRYRRLKEVTGAFTDQQARRDVIGTFWDEFDKTVMSNTTDTPVDCLRNFAFAPWSAKSGSLPRLNYVIGKLLKQREREWGKPPPDDFDGEPLQANEEEFIEDISEFRKAIALLISIIPTDQRYIKKLEIAKLIYAELAKAPGMCFGDSMDANNTDASDAEPLTFEDGKLNKRAFSRWLQRRGVQVTEKTVANFLEDVSNAHATVQQARKDSLA